MCSAFRRMLRALPAAACCAAAARAGAQAARACASAPIPTTCRSRTSRARGSRTGSSRSSPQELGAERRLHLVGAAARLRAQHAQGRAVRSRARHAEQHRDACAPRGPITARSTSSSRRADGPAVASFDDPAAARGARSASSSSATTASTRRRRMRCRGAASSRTCAAIRSTAITPSRTRRRASSRRSPTGEIDVAVVWGPLAGYFAPRQTVPLRVTPVQPQIDGPRLPMTFDISMGVRREDEALRQEIDAILARRKRRDRCHPRRLTACPRARRRRRASEAVR